MRVALLIALLIGLGGIGVLDLLEGHVTTGTAALLLAVANLLLLTGGS